MSKDASYTYLHTHSSRLADLFEDFCHPPSSSAPSANPTGSNPSSNTNNASNLNANAAGSSVPAQLPGHFLSFEEIHLPPHLMPVNPEDEDDVVPDMHAAFGINAALGGERNAGSTGNGVVGGGGGGEAGQAVREPVWRDFGLERLVDGGPVGGGIAKAGNGVVGGMGEGRRSGVMLLR